MPANVPTYLSTMNQQFGPNSFNNNGVMSLGAHIPPHAIMNNNNHNNGMPMMMKMTDFAGQQQQLHQHNKSMAMIANQQQQQAMMNIILQRQQQLQQNQPQSTPPVTGLCAEYSNRSNNLPSNCFTQSSSMAPLPVKMGLPAVEDKRISNDESKDSSPNSVESFPPMRSSPHRNNVTKLRKEDLNASTTSLVMDSIFSGEKIGSSKMNGSAMSIMSLSVDNLGGGDSVADVTDPDHLGPLFDSSLKLGTSKPTTKDSFRLKRSNSNEESISQEHGMTSVLEMSVNTIGGEMSELDDSYVKMTASQADMSFANVFEEAEPHSQMAHSERS